MMHPGLPFLFEMYVGLEATELVVGGLKVVRGRLVRGR